MKKRIFLALFLVIGVLLFTSCEAKKGNEISVNVKICADYEIINDTVKIKEENASAADAIVAACQAKKLAYTAHNGLYDGFAGVKSTLTDGWLLYINGTLAQVGAQQTSVKDGDSVEFRYENYESVFAQNF